MEAGESPPSLLSPLSNPLSLPSLLLDSPSLCLSLSLSLLLTLLVLCRRLNIAACSLGAAHTAMDIGLKYIRERKQFGRAISDYQATQVSLSPLSSLCLSHSLALSSVWRGWR
jgi:hypothetical protein